MDLLHASHLHATSSAEVRALDYLHLTKRFGAVASSQLPFHYLLSLKTPYSPLQLLTRTSHESLIALHQLLGRIITILLYVHAILYLNFYIQNSLLLAKLVQFYVLCGVFAVIAFTTIVTTALKPVRDWSYRIFYVTHVALAVLLLPTLYFHVHHVRIYVYETLAVYILHAILRFLATSTYTTGTIKQVSGTDLVEIAIPLDGKFSAWQPGQHAYISLKGHPLLRTFRSNPFTVASVPSVDGQLRFVARILDGNTAKLARSAEQAQSISVEGPYGLTTHADALLGYDRVLFVAGGAGATFIVPLYRQLLADLSPGKGSHRRQKVSFVWVARTMADVTWALPSNEQEREGFVERLEVHLTRDAEGNGSGPVGKYAIGDDDDDIPGEEGIEMEEQKTLLSSNDQEASGKDALGIDVCAGRPNLAATVEQVLSHGGDEKVAVLVCAPKGLSRSLRGHIEPLVKKGRGRDVWFWNEAFGL